MNMNELKKLINKGETETVEFKASFQKNVIETVVAFTNAKGGRIFVGVSDAKKISGVRLSGETLNEWLNQIKNSTYPSILPDLEAHSIDGKNIVEINVGEHPIKPVAYKNRYFKRIKNSNHLMTLDEIANEHLKTINSSWDYHIDPRHDFSDISMDKIVGLIDRIEKYKGKPFEDNPLNILKKYELIKADKLTFAAYLLFVENLSAITSLEIGRFKSETTIIDSISLNSDLVDQIDRSIDFIKKNLMVAFVITGKPEREERYDYPLEAIRELVVNMVVHRDYRDSGNSVIKIYDDRIEFFNPGKLHGDLTVEKLQSGDYSSRTRNRAVANIFKECGIIERYGSGIKRVQNACAQHGIPSPLFEEFQHGFKVTLLKPANGEGVSEGV
ncbi:MAG: ATP-binding protein, partial [Desulfobacterales bacterium]